MLPLGLLAARPGLSLEATLSRLPARTVPGDDDARARSLLLFLSLSLACSLAVSRNDDDADGPGFDRRCVAADGAGLGELCRRVALAEPPREGAPVETAEASE